MIPASDPSQRATERFWTRYTLVWGTLAGIVMLSGLAQTWGDVPLMLFGAVLATGAIVGPLRLERRREGTGQLRDSAAFKSVASVVLLSFGLNYSQTPFFFDVLHMHYGFDVTVTIDRNPVFLYLLTVPYFATYFVICVTAYRWVRGGLSKAPTPVRWIAIGLTPFAVAFLETAMNANPFLEAAFCYDDMTLMYTFGTFTYGLSFVLIMPVWVALSESRAGLTMGTVVAWTLAAVYIDALLLDLLRYNVAPWFTTVIEDAPGLRDFGANCLGPSPT